MRREIVSIKQILAKYDINKERLDVKVETVLPITCHDDLMQLELELEGDDKKGALVC